jgi:bacillithiol system protein YtxJ
MGANIRPLETLQDVDRALELSHHEVVVLYKHSPICSASDMAIDEIGLFAQKAKDTLAIFIVDVLESRPASLKIEALTGVRHESPQVLVMRDGAPVWHASHRRIRADELHAQIGTLAVT